MLVALDDGVGGEPGQVRQLHGQLVLHILVATLLMGDVAHPDPGFLLAGRNKDRIISKSMQKDEHRVNELADALYLFVHPFLQIARCGQGASF